VLTLMLASVFGVAFGWLPDEGKSITFIAGGCFIAFNSKALLPICKQTSIRVIGKLLCMPLLQFFGAISYSLYLWQQLFTASPTAYHSSSLLEFPLVALLIACFSYRYLEKAGGVWLRQKILLSAEAGNLCNPVIKRRKQ